ncbi:LOW QUALITY PROTEIN: hypothetical protein TorRG33x02_309750, partial [Trema orientale]
WTSGIRPVRLLLETLNSFKFEKSNRGISPPSSLFSARNTVRPEILDKSGNVPNNLLDIKYFHVIQHGKRSWKASRKPVPTDMQVSELFAGRNLGRNSSTNIVILEMKNIERSSKSCHTTENADIQLSCEIGAVEVQLSNNSIPSVTSYTWPPV